MVGVFIAALVKKREAEGSPSCFFFKRFLRFFSQLSFSVRFLQRPAYRNVIYW